MLISKLPKALIRSAILPGLGQAYNHQYWKIPIVYAGFGALIYAGEFNRKNYRLLKEVYRNMIDGVPTDYDRYSRQSVRLAGTTIERIWSFLILPLLESMA